MAARTSPWSRWQNHVVLLAVAGIACHFMLTALSGDAITSRVAAHDHDLPLLIVLVFGGLPQLAELAVKLRRREWGADMLAGISIVASVAMGEFLAGAFVVLMAASGKMIEAYAVRNASSVLEALAQRMPAVAHRKRDGLLADVPMEEIRIGDQLVVLPHESCPVDGWVLEGHGSMDESYLTGEPYVISKGPGSEVLSGAVNGESALTIEAARLPIDSRYAKIMRVMQDSAQRRPNLRRLGDRIGTVYAPLALALAIAAGWIFHDAGRFLAVLVVATPCPLLIGIPVAVIGSISLSARRGIIIKDPAVLEEVDACRTAVFDKTGTLTYGRPDLTEILTAAGISDIEALSWVASLERYSRHPLSKAVLQAAEKRGVALSEALQISERPGEGMTGEVAGRRIAITSRKKFLERFAQAELPAAAGGMECIVLADGRYAATFRFRDQPRQSGEPFIRHLKPKHHFDRVLLVSGDRESEVRYLADKVGIKEVHFGQSPEQKLALVKQEAGAAPTLFMGDGINDAPALTAATVGIAFGKNSDITSEAAGAVILESSLQKVDELLHIGRRMRSIALQSAIGGMALSLAGMLLAALGHLAPVAGAVVQEAIDVAAILNALRAAAAPRTPFDF